MNYDNAAIAKATSSETALVTEALTHLVPAFLKYRLTDPRAIAGALATVAVECGFKCQREQGNMHYFLQYNNRADLGNVGVFTNSGYAYRGAGYIQLTGAANYKKYGDLMGVDLLKNPDAANIPLYAAEIFILYFQQHGCDTWAIRGNWRKVRHLINGGLNGFQLFELDVYNLLELFY